MARKDVLTVTLKVDIEIVTSSVQSIQAAAAHAERLREAGNKIGNKVGDATVETRVNRVSVPEPAAVAAGTA